MFVTVTSGTKEVKTFDVDVEGMGKQLERINDILCRGELQQKQLQDLDVIAKLLRMWPGSIQSTLSTPTPAPIAPDMEALAARVESLREDVSRNVQDLLSTRHTIDSLKAQAKRDSDFITNMHHDIIDLRGLLKELVTLLNQAAAASDKVAKNMINR